MIVYHTPTTGSFECCLQPPQITNCGHHLHNNVITLRLYGLHRQLLAKILGNGKLIKLFCTALLLTSRGGVTMNCLLLFGTIVVRGMAEYGT